jgi:hypothetical protein
MEPELIDSLIDDILDGNATAAKEKFDGAISVKVSDALDQRKVEIADSLYNDRELPEEDYEEEYEEEEEQQ